VSDRHASWFKFYPADFMNGVRGLTAQEVGVYTMILCRIYEENGPVEYHPLRLSTYCGMRQATFEKTLEKLVDLGKLSVAGGMVSNARAESEISNRANDLKIASKAGKASAEKRQQKQCSAPTDVQQAFNHTDTDTDTDIGGGGSARAREAERPPDFHPDLTHRERLLVAMQVDPVSGLTGRGGTQIGTPADMAELLRWLDLPGMTFDLILGEVERVMAGKADGPPSSFRYFTSAMQRLSALLSAPALSPSDNRQGRELCGRPVISPPKKLWNIDPEMLNPDGSIRQ
jgi:uncharacterized protein YdaU (DUF1376 family)